MEEIVMRVRRRAGAQRVQIEVDYLVDGRSVAARAPVRLPLSLGVSRLTFDHACELARGLEAGVRELVAEQSLFDQVDA